VLRVTADTNILISALNFSGNPRALLNLAEAGTIRLAVSNAILNEVASVLRRKKFGWPEIEIARALNQISRFAEHVEPWRKIDTIKEDPSDNRILECAATARSEYLVTGDNHLLKLGKFGKIQIVTVADFLEIQAQQGRGR
jgi:putative PIN family toxin of toxin-antitoxin system